VVVVGAGFAGLATVRALRRAKAPAELAALLASERAMAAIRADASVGDVLTAVRSAAAEQEAGVQR
jgi:cation diffusion facilitator CzcD-associated flavoprotein CzcO